MKSMPDAKNNRTKPWDDDPLGLGRIDSDRALLTQFDATAEELGQRLETLWHKARKTTDEEYEPAPGITIRVEEYGGRISCSFGHSGSYAKGRMMVITQDLRLSISPLSIHMIKSHGFFGGRGSPHRIEPNQIVRLLRSIP